MLKVPALITLFTFMFYSTPCLADSFRFDKVVAQKMDGDLNFYKKSLDSCTTLNNNFIKLGASQDKEIEVLKSKANTLNLDLTSAMKAQAEYKELYIQADKARVASELNKPSRTFWFTLGSVTSAVLISVLIVYIKK